MEIKERIQEFIDFKGLDIKGFEKEIGTSNGSWAKPKTVSEIVLLKTIARFPEISSEWLLKGKGSMFSTENFETSSIKEELIRLQEENIRLKAELRHQSDPDKSTKESQVYELWMEHMKIKKMNADFDKRMQEMYQKILEG